MFISIDRDGKLALREPDDFKRLHVEASDNEVTRDEIDRALGSIATRDNDDFWIEVAALKQLGRAGDAAWESSFDAMIASVRKFGWTSPDGQRVRAHLKAK